MRNRRVIKTGYIKTGINPWGWSRGFFQDKRRSRREGKRFRAARCDTSRNKERSERRARVKRKKEGSELKRGKTMITRRCRSNSTEATQPYTLYAYAWCDTIHLQVLHIYLHANVRVRICARCRCIWETKKRESITDNIGSHRKKMTKERARVTGNASRRR